MMKMYKKITFFMVVILWMIHATPIQAAQNSVIEKIIEEYMDARSAVLLYGETAQLSKCAVGGIVLDEKLHYDKMLENDINVLSSNYEIISIIESDIIIELVVEERLLFEYSNTTEEEIVLLLLQSLKSDIMKRKQTVILSHLLQMLEIKIIRNMEHGQE